jgi:hypothetical protein
MKQLLTFLFLISSFVSFGQFAPTSAKTKFVNGIGIGSKDTSQFTAADTIALTIARDSVMYYRYRGFWRPIATGGNLSAYKLISDTLFANGYTTRARLKQGLDSLAATKGTVNSVGLTMPSAFNVANSPITTSGTLAVTAAGNATQYIRGDGVLANLPTSGEGGGASVSYYLNGSVNQGTIGGVTYYEMNKTPIIGAGTDFTTSSNGYIASFLTDANDPALLNIPAGNWNFETFFEASSGGGSPTFYIELYKYDGTTFTLIASNSTTPKLINDGTTIEAYFSALAVPQTTLTLTDRLAVRIYVTTAGRTITLHTENGHLCQVVTTFTTGLTALNGLTAQVQYFATGTSGTDFNISSATATHTFNLPTASATNRGALSSADWTTFNNKIGAGDTAAMLLPYLRKTDTASMLSPYYRTATANAALATKLNISDTAAMLLGYTRVQRFTDSLTNVQSRIQTKQNILTLTTTGTSGAATLTGATLNIPQYQAALTNPVTGTGTTNYLPKFTGASTIGNSQVFDDGTNVLVNTTTVGVNGLLQVNGSIGLRGNTQIRQATNADGNSLQIFATQFVAGLINSSSYNYTGGGLIASVAAGDSFTLFDAGRNTSTDGRVKVINTSSGNTSLTVEKNGVYTLIASTVGNVLIGTATDNGARLQVAGSATISSTLGVTGGINQGSGTLNYNANFYTGGAVASYVQVSNGSTGSGSANGLLLGLDGTGNAYVNQQSNFDLYLRTNNTTRLTIANSGAATFSSSVTATNGTFTNGVNSTSNVTIGSGGGFGVSNSTTLTLNTPNGGGQIAPAFIDYKSNGTTVWKAGITSTNNGQVFYRISDASSDIFTIASTGAATFSSTLGINGVADNVKGGQYTATVSDRINFSGVTSVFPTFTRVGNVVVAQGAIQINPTTANTYTEFRINLPSGWGDAGTQPYCGSGTLVDGGSTTTNNDSYRPVSVSIIGNVAYISFYPRTTSTASISFSFQYILP